MTITSRYDGVCKACGGKISRGEQIEWTREGGARHLECPAEPEKPEPSYGQGFTARRSGEQCGDCGLTISAGNDVCYRYPGKVLCHCDCDEAKDKAAKRETEAPYRLSGGSGYGCHGWSVGDVRRSSKRLMDNGYPEFLHVVEAGSQYVPEDGMSFGVGDESGYTYWARCRTATDDEAAPLKAEIANREAKANAKKRVSELAKQVQTDGERPEPNGSGLIVLDGERLMDTQTIYGGGDWWVITSDAIWYVRNNGADGDAWDFSNVATGGAGAIGWRVEYSDEMADELRQLAVLTVG